MIWWEDLKWLYRNTRFMHQRFDAHRDDINANTSECAKLLYRLEEAEIQIKAIDARLKAIQIGR